MAEGRTQPGDATREVAAMADIWSHGEAYERFMGRWSRLVAPAVPALAACARRAALGRRRLRERRPHHRDPGPLLPRPADRRRPVAGAGRRGRPADPRPTGQLRGRHRRATCPRGRSTRWCRGWCSTSSPTPTPPSRRWPGRHRAASWRRTSGTTPRACRCCGRSGTSPASSTPTRPTSNEGHRFTLRPPRSLPSCGGGRDCDDVQTRAIIVPTVFEDFDDFWSPFLGGQGPAPGVRRVAGRGGPRRAPRGAGRSGCPRPRTARSR